MANARQRALLSALGIQQWIPRAVKTVNGKNSDANQLAQTAQLWRQGNDHFYIDSLNSDGVSTKHHLAKNVDKALESPIKIKSNGIGSDHSLGNQQPPAFHAESIQLDAIQLEANEAEIFPAKAARLESVALFQITVSETVHHNANDPVSLSDRKNDSLGNHVSDHEVINNEFDQSQHHIFGIGAASATISFRLQACEINQWIILIHEDDLQDSAMQTLWQNILKAFNQPVITHFSWPLSEGQRWQRSTGAKSALNGFLFRMGLDKRVGLMSELSDDICPDRLERLPHLTELLAEPLKKRALWHLLKT